MMEFLKEIIYLSALLNCRVAIDLRKRNFELRQGSWASDSVRPGKKKSRISMNVKKLFHTYLNIWMKKKKKLHTRWVVTGKTERYGEMKFDSLQPVTTSVVFGSITEVEQYHQ